MVFVDMMTTPFVWWGLQMRIADCGLRNESNQSRESELRVTLDDLRRFAVALALCADDSAAGDFVWR
jgi:hypothetical protein